MELIQSKSLLAKLMATENLTVEQRNVSTAFFDTQKRLLVVPILDSTISSHLYDLFLGHEVAHAIWTPFEGLLKVKELNLSRSIMNVLEDSRIERKIKNKYPGLRTSFLKGYIELYEKDFFKVKGSDLNLMNYIDRVNLFLKGGTKLGIKFNEVEKQLLNEIESTETFEDVLEMTKKVMSYLKTEKEEREKSFKLSKEEDESDENMELDESDENMELDESDENMELDESDENMELDESNSSYDKEKAEKSLDDEYDGSTDEVVDGGEGIGTKSDKTDIIVAHTDVAYRQNEKKLFSSSIKNIYYGNIPKMDTSKLIINYKSLWKQFDEYLIKEKMMVPSKTRLKNTNSFMEFRKDSNKVVSYLAKEFELRKNADQMKRASISKTGELDMKRIHNYKFSDDIFKKLTVVPGGKSHGLVMFIDWSGSMYDHLNNTIKQLLNLVMFCKKVNIPFEVYAFSNGYHSETTSGYCNIPIQGEIVTSKINLLNLISSKMSASEFKNAASCLLNFIKNQYDVPHWFKLTGTPLNEAIIAAMDIIPEFQKNYKLQIVNTVFLTDGESGINDTVWEEYDTGKLMESRGVYSTNNKSSTDYIIRDPITKNEELVERVGIYSRYSKSITSSILKLFKKRTNSNVVGFYILTNTALRRNIHDYYPMSIDIDAIRIKFRKEKHLVVTTAGYDEYYLLKSNSLDIDEEVEFIVKENATTKSLVNAFSKYTGNRISNRVVLNKFINQIT
jgi:hypothetical protein